MNETTLQQNLNDIFEDEAAKELMANMNAEEQEAFRKEVGALYVELEDLFEEMENRPIYEQLSAEIIAQIPDDKLPLTVVDTICHNIPEEVSEADFVKGLSAEKRAVYVLFALEDEVDNGGFSQYYENTEGDHEPYLVAAAQTIGAPELATLLQHANQAYDKNHKVERNQKSVDEFLQAYENDPMVKFDNAYFDLTAENTIHKMLVNYIRSHVNAFVA